MRGIPFLVGYLLRVIRYGWLFMLFTVGLSSIVLVSVSTLMNTYWIFVHRHYHNCKWDEHDFPVVTMYQ